MSDTSDAPRVPGGNPADPFPIVNDALNVLKHLETYANDPAQSQLLTFYYLGGRWGGFDITKDDVALTDNAENYIVVARSTGVLSVSTGTTNWNNLDDYARVYHITTLAGVRTSARDCRGGPGGVHGQGVGGGGGSGGPAPLISDATSNRDVTPADAGSYIRFTATGAKTCTFDVAEGFAAPEEYHLANRAVSGDLTVVGVGLTINPPKDGSLVLAPGDTATVKLVDTAEADVYGSTEPAGPPPAGILPPIADDNSTFTDEGDATTGWTATNATQSITSGVFRMTKTSSAGTGGNSAKDITLPGSNLDFIFYGRVRMQQGASGQGGAIWLRNADNSRQFAFWMNYNPTGTPAYEEGTIGIQTNEGATIRPAVVATGVDTETFIEFALQYDHKWGSMNCFLKQVDGTWDLKARVAATFHSWTQVQVITLSTAPIDTWMEFDYLSICRPNIVVIGDSIAEGKTLYSPNLSLGLANYSSTWARYAALYPELRNNLVVNKGVGSETSTATLARIADATGQSPRVVFLHASTNDEVGAVSLSTRTDNIQDMIDAITAASGSTVLLNAMYGTSAYSGNTPSPDHRDYMTTWWNTNRLALTGDVAPINIMTAIVDGSGYMATGLTQADGIHPTPAGHEDIGLFIASQGYAP